MQRGSWISWVVLAVAACGSPTASDVKGPIPPVDPQSEKDAEMRPIAVAPRPEGRGEGGTADSAPAQISPGGRFLTTDGKPIDLGEVSADTGMVLVFYRGHWCKECRKQLAELEQIRAALEARGYRAIAISTDPPDVAKKLQGELRTAITLLSDPGGMAIAPWGVYTPEHELARPSVFVVEKGGRIAYRHVSDSPSDRPTPAAIMTEVGKTLSSE